MQAGAVVGLLALVVIFQPELRRGLDRLGRVGSWRWLAPADRASHQRVGSLLAASAARLSRRRAGALIVIERETGLGDVAETGVRLNADLSTELLITIFAAGYPLHDGAVIIRGDRIEAAGVMLPLAERDASMEHYGTRHRAAMGISEQTDALVIVVSEETGAISLADGGRFIGDLDEHELRQRLYGLMGVGDASRPSEREALAEPSSAEQTDPRAAAGHTK
jgi:diadenylate cyclase